MLLLLLLRFLLTPPLLLPPFSCGSTSAARSAVRAKSPRCQTASPGPTTAFHASISASSFSGMCRFFPPLASSPYTQATRRAEWARRFGDDGKGVDRLLARARREGATPDDLDSAQKFVRSVDGTLGDTINPEARRLFGNMIVYQNVRLLPLMIFSSLVDPMGITVRGGTVGDAFQALLVAGAQAVGELHKGRGLLGRGRGLLQHQLGHAVVSSGLDELQISG